MRSAGALFFLLFVTLSGCDRAPTAAKLLSSAQQLEAAGDLKSAEIELKNALQREPDNPDARLLLGQIYYKLGNLESSEKELEKALELRPENAQAVTTLARIWLRLGKADKVVEQAKLAASTEKEASPELLVIRANAYASLSQHDEAKNAFDRAFAIAPENAEVLLGQAKLALLEKQFDHALNLADQALAKDPKLIEAQIFKGDLLRFTGKSADAMALYRQAIAQNPSELGARLNLISLLLNAKQEQQAQTEIDAARKLAPKNLTVQFMQALLHHKAGRPEQSEEALQEVLKVADDHTASLILSGANQLALGHAEQAVQSLGVVVAKAPENLHARKLLASAHLASNQSQKAYDAVEAGLKRAPDDAELLALGAEALTRLNELDKARQYFEKASTLDPNNSALQARLSASRMAAGDNARAELEAAATLGPEQQQAVTSAISAQIAKREYDQALKAIEAFQEKQPNNPLAYNLRGIALLGKKDLAEARRDFERALKISPDFFPAIANLARLDMMDKKPDAAKSRFKVLLQADKKNLPAMLALSNLALSANEKAESISWLETARRENPERAEPLLALVRLHLQYRDAATALQFAKEAEAKHPQKGEVLDLLGQVQLANKQVDDALATYTKLTRVEERSPSAYYRLASVQAAAGKSAPALQSLKKALDLRPDFLEAMIASAAIYTREGWHEEAQQIALGIQKRMPKSAAGFLVEADVFLSQGKSKEAAQAVERAYALEPTAPVVIKFHEALVAAGEAAKAKGMAEGWIKQHPDDLLVSQHLGQRELAAGDYKSAAARYEVIVARQPNNAQALNNYAWALGQLKHPRALEYAEKAHAIGGDHPTILDTLGVLLLDAGKHERALKLLRAAADAAPEAADLRYHLARALVKTGANDQARIELERALEKGQPFPELEAARQMLTELKK